jgi:hypothetical protein
MECYFDVPFKDKDKAKQLGMRFDSDFSLWHFSEFDWNDLTEDLPKDWKLKSPPCRVHAPINIVSTQSSCHKCGQLNSVILIVSHHIEFYTKNLYALTDITGICDEIRIPLKTLYPNFKYVWNKTKKGMYFQNICPKCNSLYGEHFMLNEPEGEFVKMPDRRPSFKTEPFVGEGIYLVKCEFQSMPRFY